METNCRFRWNV